jgi:hypothetical protein
VLPELADKELILVTTRNGAYFVVEREPSPPSRQPTSYVVPLTAVDAARVGRFGTKRVLQNLFISRARSLPKSSPIGIGCGDVRPNWGWLASSSAP